MPSFHVHVKHYVYTLVHQQQYFDLGTESPLQIYNIWRREKQLH